MITLQEMAVLNSLYGLKVALLLIYKIGYSNHKYYNYPTVA